MLRSTEKGSQTLRYFLHDDPDAFRMELGGSLTHPGAESAYRAWQSSMPVLGGRPVIVDISFVRQVDQAGRDVLRRWRQQGAQIIARSSESRALAGGFAAEPAPLPAPKRSWRHGFIARLVPAMRAASIWENSRVPGVS